MCLFDIVPAGTGLSMLRNHYINNIKLMSSNSDLNEKLDEHPVLP